MFPAARFRPPVDEKARVDQYRRGFIGIFMAECLVKLLGSLDYPEAKSFDLSNHGDVVKLVCWLEDRKIRKLPISDREGLRTANEAWSGSFNNYLNILDCPYAWGPDDAIDVIFWLTSHAVAMEYEDISDTCKNMEDSQTTESFSLDIDEEGIKRLGELMRTTREPKENTPGQKSNHLSIKMHSTAHPTDFLARIGRKVRLMLTPGAKVLRFGNIHLSSFVNRCLGGFNEKG